MEPGQARMKFPRLITQRTLRGIAAFWPQTRPERDFSTSGFSKSINLLYLGKRWIDALYRNGHYVATQKGEQDNADR